MSIRDLAYEVMSALKANKGRSALTILGIVIGISAVVMLTSLIAGYGNILNSEVGGDKSRAIDFYVMDSNVSVSLDDIKVLAEKAEGIESLSPAGVKYGESCSLGQKRIDAMISPSSKNELLFVNDNSKVKFGRFINESDDRSSSRVCVLDKAAVTKFFGSADYNPVGQVIKIGNSGSFTVIGTLTTDKESFDSGQPKIYIPFNTWSTQIGGVKAVTRFMGLTKEGYDPNKARDNVIELYNKMHPETKQKDKDQTSASIDMKHPGSALQGITSKDISEMIEQITMVFSVILGGAASVSLLVGGIGIMNMMLTNVSERIREIGLRKSLGARSKDISRQFLLESVVLCVLGGIIGLILGMGSAWLIAVILRVLVPSAGEIVPQITPGVMMVAFGVSTITGIVFGYSPARRAARLDPVESLRHQ